MKRAAANVGAAVKHQDDLARKTRTSARTDEFDGRTQGKRQEPTTGRVEALLRTHASLVHELE